MQSSIPEVTAGQEPQSTFIIWDSPPGTFAPTAYFPETRKRSSLSSYIIPVGTNMVVYPVELKGSANRSGILRLVRFEATRYAQRYFGYGEAEFGRTNYCQANSGTNFGRDHHPRNFSVWFAGGGTN